MFVAEKFWNGIPNIFTYHDLKNSQAAISKKLKKDQYKFLPLNMKKKFFLFLNSSVNYIPWGMEYK